MPRTSNKAEKRLAQELNTEERKVLDVMASEVAVALEKIKLFNGTITDILARCEEELGVSKSELRFLANSKMDPDKCIKKYLQDQAKYEAAEDLGYVELPED